jgi:hypothetical protein
MCKIKTLLLLFISWQIMSSCEKGSTAEGSASLTIINAVVGSNQMVTNFSNNYLLSSYYKSAQKISYGSYSPTVNEFNSFSGTTNLTLYQMPDTTEKSSPFYDNLNLSLPLGSINTLFLTGTVKQPDTLFTTDNPPYHTSSDSSLGIRFVNLSVGSNPVNVTLLTSITTNEFANVAYKNISDFKNYPATASINNYTFQIRDASTNKIIASQTFNGINDGLVNTKTNQYRFRNFTIALIGQAGGVGANGQKALLINNY